MVRTGPIDWLRRLVKNDADSAHSAGRYGQASVGQEAASIAVNTGCPKPKPVRPSSNEQGSSLALVVSFPKSGRTWLRVMLDELDIPCSYSHDRSSHREAFHADDVTNIGVDLRAERFVFVHRDPRDTAVSGYFQAAKRLRNYDGDISAFIRDPHHGVEKIARFNIAWLTTSPEDKPVHRLSYEQLTADTEMTLRSLIDWLGVDMTPTAIESVVANNTFDKMQERELSGSYADRYGRALRRPDSSDPDSFKVRRGQVGGFRDSLSDADIAYCDEALARLNYWGYVAE